MIVSVRAASGLPVGDPVSRKCQPYVILTVVENPKDEPSQQVETFSHRLQTKKGGGDTGPATTPAAAAAIAHNHSHHHSAPNPQPPNGAARKHPAGSKERAGAEKTFSFQWDEEFLLPGVSDSATIVFTVLHQAPTKVVCLGQALVEPKQFSKNTEHVRTVSLAKQQVAVPSGPRYRGEEARMTNADWTKPGNLTFTIKKSTYCEAHCSEVNGPIVEEVNTIALSESQEGRRQDNSGPGPAATAAAAGKPKRGSQQHGGKRRQQPGGNEPAHDTPQPSAPPSGAAGRTGANRMPKVGDLSTLWWACVWQGYLRIYRHMGDSHPKLALPLDRWGLAPSAEVDADEENNNARTVARDLRLFCSSPKRWLVLRCATQRDRLRWEEVIAKNQGSSSSTRRKHSSGNVLDQAAVH